MVKRSSGEVVKVERPDGLRAWNLMWIAGT
jgi:hypothetical protein